MVAQFSPELDLSAPFLSLVNIFIDPITFSQYSVPSYNEM